MHGRLIVRKISSDGSDAIRVADDQAQSVTADLGSDGQARYEVAGRSRQNEEGVLDVCRILAQRLRRDDGTVGEPRRVAGREIGIDCEIPTGEGLLQVQVTRPATPEFWQQLNRNATAQRLISSSNTIEDLPALVEAKARRTSAADRARVVLALDATETAVHAMPSVAQAARGLRGVEIAARGFKAVWIVGPSEDLVFRIDQVSC
jgi:hypothetical protein